MRLLFSPLLLICIHRTTLKMCTFLVSILIISKSALQSMLAYYCIDREVRLEKQEFMQDVVVSLMHYVLVHVYFDWLVV